MECVPAEDLCSLHTVAYRLLAYPFDNAGIVIAVPEMVIESGEAVPFTGVFHLFQLLLIELRVVDVSPIESRGIHRETRSHGTVGSDVSRCFGQYGSSSR